MTKIYSTLILMLVGCTDCAYADNVVVPVPDKSQYSIFNPTPGDMLRPLDSERPITVDAGHFQIDMDFANYAYGTYKGVTSESFVTADPLIKLGLTNNIDFEIQPGSYQRLRDFDAKTHQTISHAQGYGDIIVSTKINMIGNDGGPFAIAIAPFVKIPSSVPFISNGKLEGGVQLPMLFNLPGDFALIETPEFDLLRNELNSGVHAGYSISSALSRAIPGIDKLSGFIEFYAQSGSDRLIPPIYTFDLGLGYLLTPQVQLVSGINFGLNNAAPKLQLSAGILMQF